MGGSDRISPAGGFSQRDAYELVLDAIDRGQYRPGDRLVEADLAERFGVSRTPIREAFQRLETQGILTRDGRSLVVAALNHDQIGELYVLRAELEALAARLAAQHAAPEEIRVLEDMVEKDRALVDAPERMSQANKCFHRQIHLASHNRYLIQQLELVHRSMALMSVTTFRAEGRADLAIEEHRAIVAAIAARDAAAADAALRAHISAAYETRLKQGAGQV
ncbi:MAG: GntR family transcriptional regulator [Pseudomonadota bacterium]